MRIAARLHEAAVRGLRRLGWDVRRHPGSFDFAHRRSVLLARRGIDLVVDVGANAGQYARELREYGYVGAILSLEPLSGAYAELARRAARDPAWTALRTAAGAHAGEITVNVAANSDSSSILPMAERHRAAAPQSAYVGTERAPIDRLDAIAGDAIARAARAYLKIDTQGYEWEVLDGAAESLPRLAGVELELSLVELYEGQRSWLALIDRLRAAGMRPVGLSHDFWDERTGETLQVDAIFVRDD
ncbi:MAG: FkbM family methyltransferase [Solirubrobacteraceae bacterium]|nr:FkbM family methyltransferase [Solirubrobacteraceae bacterium]